MIEGNTNPDWLGNQTIYEMISRRFQCFVVVVCQRIGQIATLRGLVIKIFLQKVLQYVCMRGQTAFYMFRFHKILRNMCQRIAGQYIAGAGDQNISPCNAMTCTCSCFAAGCNNITRPPGQKYPTN